MAQRAPHGPRSRAAAGDDRAAGSILEGAALQCEIGPCLNNGAGGAGSVIRRDDGAIGSPATRSLCRTLPWIRTGQRAGRWETALESGLRPYGTLPAKMSGADVREALVGGS